MMANSDNPTIGKDFETKIKNFFAKKGIYLEGQAKVKISANNKHVKEKKFDFISEEKKLLIECKRYTWTKGDNCPSAKLATINEAMYYFSLAKEYYGVFIINRAVLKNKSLAEEYIKKYKHLVPDNVTILEYDLERNNMKEVYPLMLSSDK